MEQKTNKKRCFWSKTEDHLLIEQWQDFASEQRFSIMTEKVKEETLIDGIETKLLAHGYSKSVPEIKDKILRIKNMYRKQRENLSTFGGSSTWPLYSKVHELLGKHYKTSSKATVSTRCAEIFHQSDDEFYIVCAECEMKTFAYGDFLEHFRKVHSQSYEDGSIDENDDISSNGLEKPIKCEEIDLGDCVIEYIDEGAIFPDDEKEADYSYLEIDEDETEEELLPNVPCLQESNQEKTKEDIILKAEYLCDVRQIDFLDPDEMSAPHVGVENNNVPNAPQKFASKGRKRKSSMNRDEHICVRCNKKFLNERLLRQHCLKEYGGYPCGKCEKLLTDVRQVKSHERLHQHVITSKKVKYFFEKPKQSNLKQFFDDNQ